MKSNKHPSTVSALSAKFTLCLILVLMFPVSSIASSSKDISQTTSPISVILWVKDIDQPTSNSGINGVEIMKQAESVLSEYNIKVFPMDALQIYPDIPILLIDVHIKPSANKKETDCLCGYNIGFELIQSTSLDAEGFPRDHFQLWSDESVGLTQLSKLKSECIEVINNLVANCVRALNGKHV